MSTTLNTVMGSGTGLWAEPSPIHANGIESGTAMWGPSGFPKSRWEVRGKLAGVGSHLVRRRKVCSRMEPTRRKQKRGPSEPEAACYTNINAVPPWASHCLAQMGCFLTAGPRAASSTASALAEANLVWKSLPHISLPVFLSNASNSRFPHPLPGPPPRPLSYTHPLSLSPTTRVRADWRRQCLTRRWEFQASWRINGRDTFERVKSTCHKHTCPLHPPWSSLDFYQRNFLPTGSFMCPIATSRWVWETQCQQLSNALICLQSKDIHKSTSPMPSLHCMDPAQSHFKAQLLPFLESSI